MEQTNIIGFTDFNAIGNSIYFSDIFTGSIMKVDLDKDLYYVVERSYINKRMQYGKVREIEGKLFFIPRNATKIKIYDIKTSKKELLEIRGSNVSEKPLFVDSVLYNNFLYLIPGRFSYIVELNITDLSVMYYHIDKEPQDLFSNCAAVLVDHNIWIFNYNGSLTEFDLERKDFKVLNNKFDGFTPLCSLNTENNIICSGFGSKILIFDKQSRQEYWINTYPDCLPPAEGFSNLLSFGDDIYMIALNEPRIYKMSADLKEITLFIEFDWGSAQTNIWNLFTKCDAFGAGIYQNSIIFYSSLRNAVIEISIETKKIKYHDLLKWDNENKKSYIMHKINQCDIIREGIVGLQGFLDILSS